MRTQRSAKIASGIVALLLALAAYPFAVAQQPETPTLDAILQRLEDNLRHYDAQVPSFLCDEHAESQITPSPAGLGTVTESTFRLRRDTLPSHGTVLNEFRDIKTVNGRPASNDEISGPSILSGAFSGGLAVVSLSQKVCMSYKLKPIKSNRPNNPNPAPYIIEFSSLPTRERTAGVTCILEEDGHGRVLIDPISMQITRMELTAPHHIITPAKSRTDPAVTGPWVITVDFNPVQLGGQTFWMPNYITSTMTHDESNSVSLSSGRNRTTSFDTVNSTVWSFQAGYNNYHKLEVTSRIVPVDDKLPAPASISTDPVPLDPVSLDPPSLDDPAP